MVKAGEGVGWWWFTSHKDLAKVTLVWGYQVQERADGHKYWCFEKSATVMSAFVGRTRKSDRWMRTFINVDRREHIWWDKEWQVTGVNERQTVRIVWEGDSRRNARADTDFSYSSGNVKKWTVPVPITNDTRHPLSFVLWHATGSNWILKSWAGTFLHLSHAVWWCQRSGSSWWMSSTQMWLRTQMFAVDDRRLPSPSPLPLYPPLSILLWTKCAQDLYKNHTSHRHCHDIRFNSFPLCHSIQLIDSFARMGIGYMVQIQPPCFIC